MINLKEIIDKSKQQEVTWHINEFYEILDLLKKIDKIEISYWDDEESWAQIIFNDMLIGYIWNRYPIILIVKKSESILHLYLEQYQFISIVSVSTLVSKELYIDRKTQEEIQIYTDVEQDFISAEDLWFYTNSI